jgi:hypothetical protein
VKSVDLSADGARLRGGHGQLSLTQAMEVQGNEDTLNRSHDIASPRIGRLRPHMLEARGEKLAAAAERGAGIRHMVVRP